MRASHCGGFSCCGAWALGARASVVVAHGLSCSAACGIRNSWTRDRTHVPCIGRQIRNHCTTREVPTSFLKQDKSLFLFYSCLGMATAQYYRDLGIFYLLLYHPQILCFHLIVHDGCSSSSHYFCITSSRKGEKGTWEIVLFAFKGTTQELVTSLLFILCGLCSIPFQRKFHVNFIYLCQIQKSFNFIFLCATRIPIYLVFSPAFSFGCHPLPPTPVRKPHTLPSLSRELSWLVQI